ncbi:hypothetical protein M569_01669, partial [Genlisea aurea]
RPPRSKLTSEIKLHLCGSYFDLDKELLASKSARIAKILRENPQENLSVSLHDIPADSETIEIVAKFCHGFDVDLTPENAVPVICAAHYLAMTESHCPDNLQNRAVVYFQREVLPSWTNCLKALKNSVNLLHHAAKLGLLDLCVDSVVAMVREDPRLLGDPLRDGEMPTSYRPNPRRKLFDLCWKSEDLTSLPLELYEPIVESLVLNRVPGEFIASNLCEYARTWLFSGDDDDTPMYETRSKRLTVEALVRMLLPDGGKKGSDPPIVVPSPILFRLLRYAVALEATAECRSRLETAIGRQLDRATPADLMIPSRGYSKGEKYDTECVRRILKNFYCSYAAAEAEDGGGSRLTRVSELIEEFLAEISSDGGTKISTFTEFAEMSAAAASSTGRSCDGIYRAVDIYLERHREMTKSEREELCKVVDCSRMSGEALQHAAQNERLPVRVVVQALFVVQLKLRETVASRRVEATERQKREEEEEEVEEEEEEEEEEDEAVRAEIEKMGSKVMELEKECCMMRREIESSRQQQQQKVSVWKEVKRKFGCVGTAAKNDCNCHVKKKK